MKKINISTPTLFPRGKKKILYFRIKIGDKDKWVSTKTTNKQDALKVAVSIAEAEFQINKDFDSTRNAKKLAKDMTKKLVKEISGVDIQALKLCDAMQKWIDMSPDYNDISERRRKTYPATFNKFVNWAAENKLDFIEDVSNEDAMKYAKVLWESNIAPATYNEHLLLLSRIFSKLDTILALPDRNPFDSKKIPRKKKNELNTEGHCALELEQLNAVISEAAKESLDFRDLCILGANTGARLKDCVLMKWTSVSKDFIEYTPYKTQKTGGVARVPISKMLQEVIDSRYDTCKESEFIIPELAKHYLKNDSYIINKTKSFFVKALGKSITNKKVEKHRKRSASLYSFHSFRVTFMSLLALEDVSIRDAMRIMAWDSPNMIKVYEKMLEHGKKDADKRAVKMILKIDVLNENAPAFISNKKLSPNKEALEVLVLKYSNITIGKIYNGISEAAVRKHMKKYGVVRDRRIESADITDEEINKIKLELMEMYNENN